MGHNFFDAFWVLKNNIFFSNANLFQKNLSDKKIFLVTRNYFKNFTEKKN